MEKGDLSYILWWFFGTVVCSINLIKILKQYKNIKPDSSDATIKAVVVALDFFIAGDVAPIALYTSKFGEKKKYKYYYWYNRKKYPIGKEVYLKISSASGLAYDKTDLIKGILFYLFFVLFCLMAVLIGVYGIFFMKRFKNKAGCWGLRMRSE